MLNWLDSLSYRALVPIAILLGLAPFRTQPHLIEKLGMLAQGTLVRPLDIFDLMLHATPIVVVLIKLVRDLLARGSQAR
jgi:hypothetical protein